MSFWSKLNPLNIIDSISEGYQAHQNTKAERIKAKGEVGLASLQGKVKIEEAKIDLAITTLKAKAKQVEQESEHTQDYDMQVLKNRDKSWADEFIIVTFFATYIAHFIPWTQPYMADGWAAMGYATSEGFAYTPWWLEFGMVLILVSTLGGMRVLKLFAGRFKKDKKEGKE